MASVNIHAAVSPLIPAGTPAPLQLNSPALVRTAKFLPVNVSQTLARDIDNLGRTVNALHKNQQTAPAITQLLLTNAAGEVTAAFGNTTYQGVLYTNYLSEIHVGNPLKTQNPQQALFNANLDGSVSVGQNGWIDVHDPFEGNAAWIGTQYDSIVISGAVNNGSGEIRLSTLTPHTLISGDTAATRNLNLWNVPNGVGVFQVTVIDASTIDLNGSVWSGPYGYIDQDGDVDVVPDLPEGLRTYQATIQRILHIAAITKPGAVIQVQTTIPHTYETGDLVDLNLPAPAPVSGQWPITVIDPTNFTLDGSTAATVANFAGATTCLRYFAGILAQTFAVGDSFPNYKLRAFANGDLKIRDAFIQLSSTSGSSILLDPTSGQITLSAPTPSLAKIILDSTIPAIKLYNAAGVQTIEINSNGTFSVTGSISGTFTLAKLTTGGSNGFLTFSGGFLTAGANPT